MAPRSTDLSDDSASSVVASASPTAPEQQRDGSSSALKPARQPSPAWSNGLPSSVGSSTGGGNGVCGESLLRHHPHRHNLYHPPPESMTLSAALLLLDSPLANASSVSAASSSGGALAASVRGNAAAGAPTGASANEHVYLLPRPYLRKWILWAYHQPVPPAERGRVRLALRMACELYGLTGCLPDSSNPNSPQTSTRKELAAGAASVAAGNAAAETAPPPPPPPPPGQADVMTSPKPPRPTGSSPSRKSRQQPYYSQQQGQLNQPLPLARSTSLTSNVSVASSFAEAAGAYVSAASATAGGGGPARSAGAVETEAGRDQNDAKRPASEASAPLEPPQPPGPLDATPLSLEGHPLLLKPNVIVGRGDDETDAAAGAAGGSTKKKKKSKKSKPPTAPKTKRSLSFTGLEGYNAAVKASAAAAGGMNADTNGFGNDPALQDASDTSPGGKLGSAAVPSRFYDLLRSVHGVVCDDGWSVSYQPPLEPATSSSAKNGMLHHHKVVGAKEAGAGNASSPPKKGLAVANGGAVGAAMHSNDGGLNGGGGYGDYYGDSPVDGPAARPVEFRRMVLPNAPSSSAATAASAAPAPATAASKSVEVHPIKLLYTLVSSTPGLGASPTNVGPAPRPNGFLLSSKSSSAHGALASLIKCAAPDKSHSCVRVWGKYGGSVLRRDGKTGATKEGDGWELVDLEWLKRGGQAEADEANTAAAVVATGAAAKDSEVDSAAATLSEWLSSKRMGNLRSAHLLIELRTHPTSPWSRSSLELPSRLSVGDFVDAQDTAGKWYEAIVREVHPNAVRVHYCGWNSRWDTWVPKRKLSLDEELDLPVGCKRDVSAPCPLWSKTGRWREEIAIGSDVEVREASSMVQRPKWFRATIRAVGHEADISRDLIGGSELEAAEDDERFGREADGSARRKRSLLLLRRSRQVLVEVPQERYNTATAVDAAAAAASADNVKQQPRRLPISPSFDSAIMGDTGSNAGSAIDDDEKEDIPKPNPPYLRWVNLYGEEICRAYTHNKRGSKAATAAAAVAGTGSEQEPATIQYAHHPSRERVEIMKSYGGRHGEGYIRESIRGVPPAPGSVGLQNLGNSCFLNSIIQCLNHIEPLTKFFLGERYLKDLNEDNPLGSGGKVARAYANLLGEMWGGEYSTLAPRYLKQTVGLFAPQFNNVYQHDSQEFCSFLMDGLHEDLNRVVEKPYVEDLEARGMADEDAAIESWKKHLLRHDSVVVDHCQGLHRSHLTCPHCGRESVKFDVYATLSLPLVPLKDRSAIPLRDCLEQFTVGEQLDEKNAWYCPKCEKHVCALKNISLWTTPDILILHLKRFSYDTCRKRGGLVRTKLEDTVNFPVDRLDLRGQVIGPHDPDAPPVYNLFGVSEHSGSTANSGHYTATVRNSRDSKWYRFNDAHVGVTSGDAAVTGGAYLLFYQRAGGKMSKWGGLERAMRLREEARARARAAAAARAASMGFASSGGGPSVTPPPPEETDEDGFTPVKSKSKKKKKNHRGSSGGGMGGSPRK